MTVLGIRNTNGRGPHRRTTRSGVTQGALHTYLELGRVFQSKFLDYSILPVSYSNNPAELPNREKKPHPYPPISSETLEY